MGNINEHILSKNIGTLFPSLGMRESILEIHGKKGPVTTKNKKIQLIYGIWGTSGIIILTGGYITFNKVPSYGHILLWVRISQSEAFGDPNPTIISLAKIKLIIHHSRCQGNYI